MAHSSPPQSPNTTTSTGAANAFPKDPFGYPIVPVTTTRDDDAFPLIHHNDPNNEVLNNLFKQGETKFLERDCSKKLRSLVAASLINSMNNDSVLPFSKKAGSGVRGTGTQYSCTFPSGKMFSIPTKAAMNPFQIRVLVMHRLPIQKADGSYKSKCVVEDCGMQCIKYSQLTQSGLKLDSKLTNKMIQLTCHNMKVFEDASSSNPGVWIIAKRIMIPTTEQGGVDGETLSPAIIFCCNYSPEVMSAYRPFLDTKKRKHTEIHSDTNQPNGMESSLEGICVCDVKEALVARYVNLNLNLTPDSESNDTFPTVSIKLSPTAISILFGCDIKGFIIMKKNNTLEEGSVDDMPSSADTSGVPSLLRQLYTQACRKRVKDNNHHDHALLYDFMTKFIEAAFKQFHLIPMDSVVFEAIKKGCVENADDDVIMQSIRSAVAFLSVNAQVQK
jgi:hypothetical protein